MWVGLAGAGFVARIHAEAYRHVRGIDVELRWVTAPPAGASAGLRRRSSASGRVADDVRRILDDPEVDLVDLCVPNAVHASIGLKAARAGKHVIVEKPLTGFFGDSGDAAPGDAPGALASADVLIDACREAGVRLCYAENWVYAPPIQKARRLLAAAGGPILRLVGEESHSGTHAPANKRWVTAGGGSLLGKGCHPLGGILYLKADEGRRLRGRPVRPVSVLAEVAQLADTETFRGAAPQLPQHRRGSGRRGLGRRCSSASTTARSPRSPPPTSCWAGSGTSSPSTPPRR